MEVFQLIVAGMSGGESGLHPGPRLLSGFSVYVAEVSKDCRATGYNADLDESELHALSAVWKRLSQT